jgi:hypothetical protein
MADINLPDGGDYWGTGKTNGYVPAYTPPGQTASGTSDSGGNLYTTPGYTPPPAPAIGANGSVSVPRPSVDPSVVYTDTQGNGYDPGALAKAWQDPTFRNNPINARVSDLLTQYGYGSPAPAQAPPSPPAPAYGGTSVFNDPATTQFESLLNRMVNQFATPKTPPDQQQAVDQLNKYLAQLNGPTYTPEQMGMLQTQALDPINQQHDVARQQTLQRLANQGIGPSSGIAQQALQQVDQAFEQMRTQTQNQFASNAVNLSRQNAATAASLAPQISQFEYNNMTAQDPRNLQAVNLASMIPQMALQRLTSAQGGLMNPAGISPLLSLLGGFQNTGYSQGANYGSGIAQLLAALFGMG